MLDGSSCNPGERDLNGFPETSSASDADVGVIEIYGNKENMAKYGNDRSDAQGHPLKEDERDIKEIDLPSPVPVKPDKLHFGNQHDGVSPIKTHERDDSLPDPIEPAVKRLRFTFRRLDAEAVDVSTNNPETIGGNTTKPGDGTSTEFIEPMAEESAA